MQKKLSKKQITSVLVVICLVGLIGIGISYSYYLANIRTSNEENKNSNITTTTITNVVMDMQGKISSNGAYPGHKMVKEVVVRGIGESNSIPANASIQITPDLGEFSDDVTWKLYKSEEAITCSSSVHKEGNIYEASTCNIPASATLELEGAADSAYKNIVVSPNTETKYYLVVEYANNETDQSNQMGKSFNIDIGLSEYQKPNALKSIIASVDTTGKCPTINDDGTVNVTSIESTDGYLCSAKDAYGTSYYYRGNVTNNYVKFADKYWRIVRINGDGSLRVIYDGTSPHANGESSSDRQIGTSSFNYYWKKGNVQEATNSFVYLDNAGVGYMYGNRDAVVETTFNDYENDFINTSTYYIAKEYSYDVTTDRFTLKDPIAVLGSDMTSDYVGYYTFLNDDPNTSNSYVRKIFSASVYGEDVALGYVSVGNGDVRYGTSSKEVAQTNTNDSTLKAYLDNWYKTNVLGTENEQYLADNIFCNDRSLSPNYSSGGSGITETGYRWYNAPWKSNNYNKKMMLICLQQNDAFTVSNTTNGNGALTYPIGLVTTDEVVLAGGWNADNKGYYLYSGSSYWTSSPRFFAFSTAMVGEVNNNGNAEAHDTVNTNVGVRPVLNISQEVLNKGDGTMDNPYRIE